MYELSVHLNIAHNSFALVRVLRAGAFCLFQFIFERSNKEPSPERVRSERGREDKPLTPVLYSTREGGELYGAMQQLDAAMLREFIDRIEVSHTDKKSKTREITIVYNFIGAFDFERAKEKAQNTTQKQQRTA